MHTFMHACVTPHQLSGLCPPKACPTYQLVGIAHLTSVPPAVCLKVYKIHGGIYVQKKRIAFSQTEVFLADLLESVKEGNSISFHFLHPMFQEYLAVLHLVKQPPNTQLKKCLNNLTCSGGFSLSFVWNMIKGILSMLSRCYQYMIVPNFFFATVLLKPQNDVINNEVVKALRTKTHSKVFIFWWSSHCTWLCCYSISHWQHARLRVWWNANKF